jgi:uncharacterized protein YcbK (DUF882 family)
MKWFKDDDFKCNCGCGLDVTDDIKTRIDMSRSAAGVPFIITSGARCLAWNTHEGGSEGSSHMKCVAVDISYVDELDLVRKVHALTKFGFKRIGINAKKKFIHVDDDKDKSSAIFGY